MDVIFWELICNGDREEAIQVMQIYEMNQSRPSSNNRQLSIHTMEVEKSIKALSKHFQMTKKLHRPL
jgi:hypothetical protein